MDQKKLDELSAYAHLVVDRMTPAEKQRLIANEDKPRPVLAASGECQLGDLIPADEPVTSFPPTCHHPMTDRPCVLDLKVGAVRPHYNLTIKTPNADAFRGARRFPPPRMRPRGQPDANAFPKSLQPQVDVDDVIAGLDAGLSANDAIKQARKKFRDSNAKPLFEACRHERSGYAAAYDVSTDTSGGTDEPSKPLIEPNRHHRSGYFTGGVVKAADAPSFSSGDKTFEDCKARFTNLANFSCAPSFHEISEATDDGVTRAQFHHAMDALWSEFEYVNNLPRRTADEAKDAAGFATLIRRYLRHLEDHWADYPGEVQPEGNVAVPQCLHDLRKLAAMAVRGMIICGIRPRQTS